MWVVNRKGQGMTGFFVYKVEGFERSIGIGMANSLSIYEQRWTLNLENACEGCALRIRLHRCGSKHS